MIRRSHIALLAICAALLGACGRGAETEPNSGPPPTSVTVSVSGGASVAESAAGGLSFDINLSATASSANDVEYETRPGSTTAGSDYASAIGTLSIPDGTTIDVAADGDGEFPVGAVLMKNFRINNEFIETRLLMVHTDGEWAGYSYEWNMAGTDADRLYGGKVKTVSGQDWINPSGSECM